MPLVKPVETRESRLQSTVAYGGGCHGLANGGKCRCLKRLDRRFSQATVCQEWYSLFTLLTVRNAAVVVHGPVGCVSSGATMNIFSRLGQEARGHEKIRSARWFSTNLAEIDTIHGGEAKLRATVHAIEQRYHPEAIFIFTTCVSGIIGDPMADIVNQLQEEVQARLVLSQCEGFRTSVWATGFDAAFHGIIHYLLEERPEKEPDLVNIITPLTVGRLDELELERLLHQLGLRPNFVPCYAGIEDLKRTVSAAATAAACLTYGDYFARALSERYGVPHIREVMPLGIASTDRWLLELAPLLGKEAEAEALIAREHERIAPRLEELRKRLAGKRVFVSAGQARATTMAAMSKELGFEIVGATIYHYDEVIEQSMQRLAQTCGDFAVNVANVQPFEQANLLQRLKPDLYMADEMTTVWAARQGIATMMIYDYGMNYLGYNGLLATGGRMAQAMDNSSFNVKLARYNPLPYRSSWYNADPFKYITTPGGQNI